MKAIIRIPTATRYAYIEVETEGTAKNIVDTYYAVSEEYWKQKKARDKKEVKPLKVTKIKK